METVVVYSTWEEPLADMVLGLLQAEGINAVKRDSGLRSSIAVAVDGLGEIDILVHEDEVETATEVLKVRMPDSSDTDESDVDDDEIDIDDGEENDEES